jgi:hypothetical protein
MRLLFVFLALGPVAFFYALAYLLKNPADWTGPAVLLPLSLLVTIATQALGLRWIRRASSKSRRGFLIAVQLDGLVIGVAVGLMAYFILLD